MRATSSISRGGVTVATIHASRMGDRCSRKNLLKSCLPHQDNINAKQIHLSKGESSIHDVKSKEFR